MAWVRPVRNRSQKVPLGSPASLLKEPTVGRSQRAIFNCTIPVVMEFKSTPEISCESGCRKMPWQRLELYAGKLARTVLRGLGAGNRAWLPSDVGSSHERHDGFRHGREFDCSSYWAT